MMNTGKNYLDQGNAAKAVPLFVRAVALNPAQPDAHLNLANAYLLAGQLDGAVEQSQAALEYDRNLAAAYYVAGCAYLRARKFEEALKMLQTAHDLDGNVVALNYQLGRAHQELGHVEEAIAAFTDAVKLDPKHPVAHYALGQALLRVGRQDEGLKEVELHRQLQAAGGPASADPSAYEGCKFTQGRAPQVIEKPDPAGVVVTFVDTTASALGAAASQFHGPLAALDYNRDDRNSLFLADGTNGFRLLANNRGVFEAVGNPLPVAPGGHYGQILVGDLNNDRFEDILVLGEPACHLFKFATNGVAREITPAAGLKNVSASAGGLVDLDFSGKLDLLAINATNQGLRVLRNLGAAYFKDITSTSGVPAELTSARQLVIEDWNNDDLMDVIVTRDGKPPMLLLKERGGPLVPTNFPPGQLEGTVIATGDLNNDSRADLIVGAADHLDMLYGGINQFSRLPINLPKLASITLVDFDNDGWLDILLAGQGLQMWRNLGDGNFANVTAKLGLDRLIAGQVESVVAADFDQDCDTDLAVSVVGQGVKLLRNDGGNANGQIKLRLFGNRSNASGLGIRVDASVGSLRIHRTVGSMPIEIGMGKHRQFDSLTARWFELPYSLVDVKPEACTAIPILEPILPTGSCPNLYAWDGQKFRFVTDILGSAPVGLRLTDTVFLDADTQETVWLGNEEMFRPLGDSYEVRITEELRELLYLDEAKLVVADHPQGTEIHSTDKLRPHKPFPAGELWTLEHRYPLRQATRLDGSDVTQVLAENDNQILSPARLRIPQLRGLAEPHGVVLDFGTLPSDRPLTLALTGWLRFGGGMANVAASHDPDLPFPFPQLEIEGADGSWRLADVVAGAPSGKTKTILIDLTGKTRPGDRRLRVSTAFEIHWDRIALFDRRTAGDSKIARFSPRKSDLHWRGFSQFADLPPSMPLTPVYDKVFGTAPWRITPMGWCTRYGEVSELVAATDNAQVLINGGDELALRFAVAELPPLDKGMVRDFFLYTVGWDKDSDFHVELGWKVDPLPWIGMDDQRYGRDPRPCFPSDQMAQKYRTRWVNQYTLKRASR